MPTMTDAVCVNTYVNELRFNVFGQWERQTPSQRAAAMHIAVTRIHKICGIPKTSMSLGGTAEQGLFLFPRWEI